MEQLPSSACFVVMVIIVLCASRESLSQETNVIHVTGLFPLSGGVQEGDIGRGVLPAVELALLHVKESDSILKGYELRTIFNDTLVSTFSKIYYPQVIPGDQFHRACQHKNLLSTDKSC